ncbi:hypothetical protein [Xanthobacter sediminis]|uniref:hypothetical protein n=1 Tax=Xanthobacter sediminis TaxID=3119926 RepID=UPI00372B3E87
MQGKKPKAAPAAKQRKGGVAKTPPVTSVEGLPVVTIPADHYAELLECQRTCAALGARAARFAVRSRSPIENDPGVAAFLRERFGKASLVTILAECLGHFGGRRTPSRAAAHRYWQRLRTAPPAIEEDADG